MSVRLPTVEMTCSTLQQEESQKDSILHHVMALTRRVSKRYTTSCHVMAHIGNISAMYSNGATEKSLVCSDCGGRGQAINQIIILSIK